MDAHSSNPIAAAIAAAGGQRKLADALGVTPGLVSQWLTGRTRVAPRWCIPLGNVAPQAVTRYQLRPDVFGTAPVSLQEAG